MHAIHAIVESYVTPNGIGSTLIRERLKCIHSVVLLLSLSGHVIEKVGCRAPENPSYLYPLNLLMTEVLEPNIASLKIVHSMYAPKDCCKKGPNRNEEGQNEYNYGRMTSLLDQLPHQGHPATTHYISQDIDWEYCKHKNSLGRLLTQ